MNILKKVVPFRMRHGLAVLCVAGATFAACTRKEPQPVPEPTLDIEVEFCAEKAPGMYPVSVEAINDTINKYGHKNIRNIHLVPGDSWWSLNMPTDLQLLREYYLEPALAVSPKVKGKGGFTFREGLASQVPQDSLWYVQNGWTIIPTKYKYL